MASNGNGCFTVCGAVAVAAMSLFASTAAVLPSSASPQMDSSDPVLAKEPSLGEGMTVTAQRALLQRRVDAFISAMIIRSYQDSLARWNKPICPLVAGLPLAQGEYVLARLSEIALSAGARLAPRDCKANFFVVVTPEPDELLRKWRERDRSLFGALSSAGGRATRADIDDFLNTARPVRVWHTIQLRNSDSTLLDRTRVNRRSKDTRLAWNNLLALESAIVIVDSKRTAGFKLAQLTDYIALIGFTELDLDADVGDAPTILRLFMGSGNSRSGLSSWDQAFLKALYQTDQTNRMQRGVIVDYVVDNLAP